MGLLKNLALIAGGVAAGYLASRARVVQEPGSDLALKQPGTMQKFVAEDGPMAQFFDSKYGQPLKGVALKALGFAATVKAGMDEKEEELRARFDQQAQEDRPGSLDTWTPLEAHDSGPVLEARNTPESPSPTHHRLQRDAELGKDFFA